VICTSRDMEMFLDTFLPVVDTKNALGKTTIDSIKNHQRRRRRKWGCGLDEGNSCGDSKSDGGCGPRLGRRLPLRWWPRKWPMQSKQLRQRQKLDNQRSKSKIMAVKMMAEVMWRPSADEDRQHGDGFSGGQGNITGGGG